MINNKNIVIYHRADFDGIFCREIAKKFLPGAELIGWDYGDEVPKIYPFDTLYILDLSIDALMDHPGLIWIDHHKTAIEKYPEDLRGLRIDGVAACRLAWQWFTNERSRGEGQPFTKQNFVDREVIEPYAVRLAGEYDIWDKRDPDAELFQHGLRSCDLTNDWPMLLQLDRRMSVSEIESLVDVGQAHNLCRPDGTTPNPTVLALLKAGKSIQYARGREYDQVISEQGFDVTFEGHNYLACNSHELDIRSQLFAAGIKPHHEGLLGFTFTGIDWRVSLYGIPGKDVDHSEIAKRYGGGGHKNACGFRAKTLAFLKCSS